MNRNITVTDWDGIDTKDYPDFCDAYPLTAEYTATGETLTDEEMERYQETEHDDWYNQLHNQMPWI